MARCEHFQDCVFVLRHVSRVKPHWDDFVSLYCNGDFQDVCQRLAWFREHGTEPSPDLMPTGRTVPELSEM